ncbi:MAG: FAD:protein FMN transferase [Coraliomargarita sp.]
MSQIHLFEHDAMKTTFTLRLKTDDSELAQNIAHDCIRQLNEMEAQLSRYVEGGDIWKINRMQAGETLFLSDTCYECLKIALDAYIETGGLFDITLGRQIQHRKNKENGPAPEISGQLMLDPDRPAIHCAEAGRELDLGGIGKGFTLDKMLMRIQEWGKLDSALLSAGASSQLAYGPSASKIRLSGDHGNQVIQLHNQALSASGTGIQGNHIVSSRAVDVNYSYPRIWVVDSTAASAEIWSTAALLMNNDELQMLAKTMPHLIVDDPETGTLHELGVS